jgi:hypothetical protein
LLVLWRCVLWSTVTVIAMELPFASKPSPTARWRTVGLAGSTGRATGYEKGTPPCAETTDQRASAIGMEGKRRREEKSKAHVVLPAGSVVELIVNEAVAASGACWCTPLFPTITRSFAEAHAPTVSFTANIVFPVSYQTLPMKEKPSTPCAGADDSKTTCAPPRKKAFERDVCCAPGPTAMKSVKSS